MLGECPNARYCWTKPASRGTRPHELVSGMSARTHGAAAYHCLRTAWKRVVEALGGVDATAACVRVGRSQVSAYGDIHGERHVPIDVVLDAETIAGEPFVTAALASAQGFALLPIVPRDGGDLSVALIKISRHATQLLGDAAEALADQCLDDAERATLAHDLDILIRAASEARQLIGSKGE